MKKFIKRLLTGKATRRRRIVSNYEQSIYARAQRIHGDSEE